MAETVSIRKVFLRRREGKFETVTGVLRTFPHFYDFTGQLVSNFHYTLYKFSKQPVFHSL